jgi:hypothetical protein
LTNEPRLLTAEQVAKQLGVPESWVATRARGTHPHGAARPLLPVPPLALEEWIVAQESGAT